MEGGRLIRAVYFPRKILARISKSVYHPRVEIFKKAIRVSKKAEDDGWDERRVSKVTRVCREMIRRDKTVRLFFVRIDFIRPTSDGLQIIVGQAPVCRRGFPKKMFRRAI